MTIDGSEVEVRFHKALMLPERALEYFTNLVEAQNEHLTKMISWLKEAELTLSFDDNAASLAKELQEKDVDRISKELVRPFFRLESLRRALEWESGFFVDYLRHMYDEKAEELGKEKLPPDKQRILEQLFTPSDQVELLYKARRIYEGAVPSFLKSYTTVDFRPVYSKDMEIRHGLITATLEIMVRKPDETTEEERITIQIDIEDIKDLEKTLYRAKEKIRRLRESLEKQKIRLLNPQVSLGGSEK